MIEDSGVASSGTAESLLNASNINKTRRALLVTICALQKLMIKAHETEILLEDANVQFHTWCKEKCEEQATFKFWYMISTMVIIYLVLIQSFREGLFDAYKSSLVAIMPYLFANGNTHYSRWGTIHIHDMFELQNTNPDVYEEFVNGNFVLHESNRQFSGIALDQAHEHNNARVKSDGGAIGITEKESALLRWMTSSPEICQLVQSYDLSSKDKANTTTRHHEDIPSAQKSFLKDVSQMTETIEDLGNPFLEESGELVSLDLNVSTDSKDVYKFEANGQNQFETFRKQVDSEAFYSPISRNDFDLFQVSLKKQNKQSKENKLKQDCVLFSNLFVMCQTRQLDLEDFFRHENQASPPSISNDGELYRSTKSDLVTVLKDACKVQPETTHPLTDSLIIDGSMFVHCHQPVKETFAEYANEFSEKISNIAKNYSRVDIVFDEYKHDSLKSFTRKSHGDGRKSKVSSSSKVPKNWKGFLRNSHNKTELFILLAKSIYSIEEAVVYATIQNSSISNKVIRSPIHCTQEEADTRMFVHLKHSIERDFVTTASIHANDTDIIVIAISHFHELSELGLQMIWVSFGRGRTKSWYPIHSMAQNLGPLKSKALLFFHSISGCDIVSAFKNKGKKSFFQTWEIFPEITSTFVKMSTYPLSFAEEDEQRIEQFIVLLYDRSSTSFDVDMTRKKLFSQKNSLFDNIPPTSAALKYHIRRAAFQASIIWGQALEEVPDQHCPEQWGWKKNTDGVFEIYWTDLSAISESCAELCKCGCKKQCSGKCSCKQSSLPCTSRCSCPCVD